jgi:negative regulator of sigma E activity
MKAKRVDNGESESAPDDIDQMLSCLLDGEVDESTCRSVLERLGGEGGGCRRWELLSCVGDAMRSAEVAAWHRPGFVDRVAAALEHEPTVLAPVALPQRRAMRRWLMPGAGIAAAAAVLLAVGLPSVRPDAPATVAVGSPVGLQARAGDIARSPVLERYLAAHRELADPTVMPYSTPYVRTSGAILQEGQ